MRWALNVVKVTDDTIQKALEDERDHFLETSPIPTDELDKAQETILKSYKQDNPDISKTLIDARKLLIKTNPHPETPALIAQMNRGIAGAVALLRSTPESDLCNVTVSGSLNMKLGETPPATRGVRDAFGDRVQISIDFLK